GDVEVLALVDLDLDQHPEIVAILNQTTIIGLKSNGQSVRSVSGLAFFVAPGASPAFGDLGGDGVLDMALTDNGSPVLYSWGRGSWRPGASPWPMKGHDAFRTNAFSGPTVVGVPD